MKNIYLFSRHNSLSLLINNNLLGCVVESKFSNYSTGQHIYITSSEEIKETSLAISANDNQVYKIFKIDETHVLTNAGLYLKKYFKKIILTTDPILIEDGVQRIDDEFLEWFVKNPTCEFVEIDKIPDLQSYNEKTHKCELVYTIIIPQKEPKQESYICPHTKIQCDDECCVSAEDCHITSSLVSGIEEPKQEKEEEYFKHLEKDKKEFAKEWDEIRQEFGFDKKEETLEEAAENYAKQFDYAEDSSPQIDFIAGANYMSRRRYTEDEVRDLIIKALTHNDHDLCGSLVTQDNEIRTANFGVWFEHNKKDL